MRNIHLALQRLRQREEAGDAGGGADTDPQSATAQRQSSDAAAEATLIRRLTTADVALRQMAELLGPWLGESSSAQSASPTLGEAADQALALLEPAARQREVALYREIDESVAGLAAGPVQPVLLNAMRNGVEAFETGETANPATGENRWVKLRAGRETNKVWLEVSDSGPGLDPEVTDAHGQLQWGRSRKAGGHGVGLPLCRDIAERLGGSLTVTQREGGGTRLMMQYPAEAASPST